MTVSVKNDTTGCGLIFPVKPEWRNGELYDYTYQNINTIPSTSGQNGWIRGQVVTGSPFFYVLRY